MSEDPISPSKAESNPLNSDNSSKAVQDDSAEIHRLKQEIHRLEQDEALYKEKIRLLHEYNEIKDVTQMLLGKLAEIEGVCSKYLYGRFGLDCHD